MAYEDKQVALWDLRSSKPIYRIQAHSDIVTCVDLTPDSTILASASLDGFVKFWDVAMASCLKTMIIEENAPISHV